MKKLLSKIKSFLPNWPTAKRHIISLSRVFASGALAVLAVQQFAPDSDIKSLLWVAFLGGFSATLKALLERIQTRK